MSDAAPVSGYVPVLSFREDAERIIRPYISMRVERFFDRRGIQNYTEVSTGQALSTRDYEVERKGGVPFKYFYDVLFDGISKHDGEVRHYGYTLTLDEELTPRLCDASGMHYGTVCLGENPFFYYLRLDVQKLLWYLKQDGQRRLHAQYSSDEEDE